MKSILTVMFFIILSQGLFAQSPGIDNKQLLIGIIGLSNPNEVVTHRIIAYEAVWENDGTHNFFISTDDSLYNSSWQTTGNSDTSDYGDWGGWNWAWIDTGYSPYSRWGLGFYKVTNNHNPNVFFYLDTRDSDYGSAAYPPDTGVYFDAGLNEYRYLDPSGEWVRIDHNDVMRVWEMRGEPSASPNILPDYWENVLVMIDDGNDHPRLVWDPFPDDDFSVSYYKVYKKIGGGSFSLYASLNAPEYTDTEEELVFGLPVANETIAQYKVTAVGNYTDQSTIETGSTNTVEARIEGEPPSKVAAGGIGVNLPQVFSLLQNYPNPFNPTTTIEYSLKESEKVRVRVYDARGSLIQELVNQFQEAGEYRLQFNAFDIASGIYYYTLSSGSFKQTRKMLLLK